MTSNLDDTTAERHVELLLERIVASHRLRPEQDRRVRSRLGLHPGAVDSAQSSVAGLPAMPAATSRIERTPDGPLSAPTPHRRTQFIQMATAAMIFVIAGVMLTMLFRNENQPNGPAAPVETPDTATAMPTTPASATQTPVALPTPDAEGVYRDLTPEQAQAIVPFNLLLPSEVPDGFDAPIIVIHESPPLATGGHAYRVELWFGLAGGSRLDSQIHVTQQLRGGQDTTFPDAETMTVEMQGVSVSKSTWSTGGVERIACVWQDDTRTYQVIASLQDGITATHVEHVVDALLAAQ